MVQQQLQRRALDESQSEAPGATQEDRASALRGLSYDQQVAALAPVQAKSAALDSPDVQSTAATGVQGSGAQLPHLDAIQASFGRHDVSGVQTYSGGAGAEAARSLNAEAFAMGDKVASDGPMSLHTAAHEAAHVVQQRGGVQLKGNVGQVDDAYERHADSVADAVVAGRSAEGLLDQYAGGGASSGAVQARAVQFARKGMSSREILKQVKADGWYEVNTKGSHVQLKHPTKSGRVTVPHPKKDVPIGTQKSIEKQAGITLT